MTKITLAAMAVMVYALFTYHWRAASIRRGGRGPYDDRIGPVSPYVLCVITPGSFLPTDSTLCCSAQ